MKTTAGICSTSARYRASRFGNCPSSGGPCSNSSGGYTTCLAIVELNWRKTPANSSRISSAWTGFNSGSTTAEGSAACGSRGTSLESCGHENETIPTPHAEAVTIQEPDCDRTSLPVELSCDRGRVGFRQLGSLFIDDCVKRRKA